MVTKTDINNLLSNIVDDNNKNIIILKKFFNDLNYKDNEECNLLHIFVDEHYDEYKVLLVIKALLYYGLNPNCSDIFKYNFIQRALYTYPSYSEEFIINIIKESLKYGLDVNHVDNDLDTMMHSAIYSETYKYGIEKIYKLLCDNGYDSTILDIDHRNLIEAMKFQTELTDKYSLEEISIFEKIFNEKTNKEDNISHENNENNINNLSDKEIEEIEKYGVILNNKEYFSQPSIGRDNELENIMVCLAQEKKNPLLIGESGVGKTVLIHELAYRIKNGQVPDFLKNKVILEIDPSELVAGCEYRGQFEETMKNIKMIWQKYNLILFIDEIHDIYGIGSTKNKDNDMASILKKYIDRSEQKIIGTTTKEEYDEYFSSTALKRRFKTIKIEEPNSLVLYQIINKVMNDYMIKNKIVFENEAIKEQIIDILMESTSKKHRKYDDILNNPDLCIYIIDEAFAYAKVYNNEYITPEHFIKSFGFCNKIYTPTIESSITKLKNINKSNENNHSKVLTIDFKNYRR